MVWGAYLDGDKRRVSTTPDKRRALVLATLETCKMGKVPPRLIQTLCGHWQHHLAFRRCCMCVLDQTYVWLRKCYRDGQLVVTERALTRDVRDELFLLCVLAPIMHSCLDRPMAEQVIATDATIKRGAVVTAPLSSASQASFLWHASDHVSYPMKFVPAIGVQDGDPRERPLFQLVYPFVEDSACTRFVETTQFHQGP
eukprot:2214222-Amphidinium_carterae.1